ncbi:hypothetical protein PTKIN_Ptkin01aG0140500 [Pterospermum kingtungense]
MGDFAGSSSNRPRSQDPKPKEVRSENSKVEFSKDEEMLIARMFNLVGERLSLVFSFVVFDCWENPRKDSRGDPEVLEFKT